VKQIALLVLVLVAGCSKVDVAIPGNWQGGFVTAEKDSDRKKAANLKGFVQLYARKNFKMELENGRQTISFKGTWDQVGQQITLKFDDVEFDNPSEEDIEVLKLKVLNADKARDDYKRSMTLTVSPDKRTLTGLEMELDGVLGRHVFKKNGP
jgi:hypothetical protein